MEALRSLPGLQLQFEAALCHAFGRNETRAAQQFCAALYRLSCHQGAELPPIEMPACSVGIEQEIVVADDVAAPCRATSKTGFVLLVEKVLPDLQILQKQSRFRGDAFADLEGVVGTGFDNQDIANSPLAKRQCGCTAGNAAAEYHDS